jgi:hypothetical protein
MPTIGLLGATGYTGTLTTSELIRRGIPHVLGGRNAEKLKALPGDGERRVVDTTDPASLAAFCEGLDAVISCIGPFTLYGDPVVDACVAATMPYVDSTGEIGFIERVYARHANARSAIVPACGFDVIPGDLAADLACQAVEVDGGSVSEVIVSYSLHGAAPSQGTARTLVTIATSEAWTPTRIHHYGPQGPRAVISVPYPEAATVRLHRPQTKVTVGMAIPKSLGSIVPAIGAVMKVSRPLLRLSSPLLHKVVDRMPEGPDPDKREANRFTIVAEVIVSGQDPYGLTALYLVEAALRVALPSSPVGPLAPSMAFDSADFFQATGMSWLQT